MNAMDLAQALGQVDQALIDQGALPFSPPRPRRWKRLAAAALAAAMMACCFALGAWAAGSPAAETISLPAAGITLRLPDSWAGRYVALVGEDGMSCQVYVKSLYDRYPGWGVLFSAGKYFSQPMTPEEVEQSSPVPSRYLLSTQTGTYALFYASDLQYDPNDPAQTAEYRQMYQEVSQISVQVDYILYNTVQSCLRTLRPDGILAITGTERAAEELAPALSAAVLHPAPEPAGFTPGEPVTLWLAGGSGQNGPEDLRLELTAGEDGLVRARYAGLGVFSSENPDDPGFYLHEYEETIWLKDAALWALLR